ncbi:hypothetical protein ACHAWF_000373 [Thalassiosira exigua]
MYTNLKVVLKIGKEAVEISQGVGVRQGDSLSPVLFLFLMSAFAKTLESEWAEANLPKIRLHCASMETTEEFAKGQLMGHDREALNRGASLDILQILYVDDGAFFFPDRESAARGIEAAQLFMHKQTTLAIPLDLFVTHAPFMAFTPTAAKSFIVG